VSGRRIDYVDGEPDDVVIPLPGGAMFRLERMDAGAVWLCIYHGSGPDREVFRIYTPRNGRLRIGYEDERDA